MYAEGEERVRVVQPMPGVHPLYPPAPQGYTSPANIHLASGTYATFKSSYILHPTHHSAPDLEQEHILYLYQSRLIRFSLLN